MIRIRMKKGKRIASPTGILRPGEEYELKPERAEKLIKIGAAERVGPSDEIEEILESKFEYRGGGWYKDKKTGESKRRGEIERDIEQGEI